MRTPFLLAGITVSGVLAGCSSSPSPAASASPSAASRGAPQALQSVQSATVAVIARLAASVVRIDTPNGLGSGVVFDGSGDVVTNAHVIGDATSFKVTGGNGRQFPATLVGSFPPNDLAVIRVTGSATGLTPAAFADSSKLQVGDSTIAMGSPLGLTASVTAGLVSALDRTVSAGNGVTLPNTIQTSAPINPGNSGGPLVDISGSVIGINTLVALGQGGTQAQGIGFAIPSNTVKDLASQMIASGHVTNSGRAYLGVDVAAASQATRPAGAFVVSVAAGGPAEKAGIVPGDTITAVNGAPTATPDALSAALARTKPGETVPVRVTRADGSQSTIQVSLGTLPGT